MVHEVLETIAPIAPQFLAPLLQIRGLSKEIKKFKPPQSGLLGLVDMCFETQEDHSSDAYQSYNGLECSARYGLPNQINSFLTLALTGLTDSLLTFSDLAYWL